MKVGNLMADRIENRLRVSATVVWEDCDRLPQELYFETEEEFAKDLVCNPHAFLVACAPPAMYFGEKRVYIDAEVCPRLKGGLKTVLGWFHHWWYKPEQEIVRIEAKTRQTEPPKVPRAGFFFSGGVDSLATLRNNRLSYSPEHPGFIKDGLLVYGLEVRDPQGFEYVRRSVSSMAEDAGVRIIPVYTNIRSLGPKDVAEFWGQFWIKEYMGATFAAIAHAFSRLLTEVTINSCHDIPNIMPYGSHPLINPNYSSSGLQIRHEGIALSRFDKTKLIAKWKPALQHLRVCNRAELYKMGSLNCGECEKCVRTMLSLLALGALKGCTAFPVNEIDEELAEKAIQLGSHSFSMYEELIGPLSEIGREDLARIVSKKIASYKQPQWRKTLRREFKRQVRKVIGPCVAVDRQYLGGVLMKFEKLIIKKSLFADS